MQLESPTDNALAQGQEPNHMDGRITLPTENKSAIEYSSNGRICTERKKRIGSDGISQEDFDLDSVAHSRHSKEDYKTRAKWKQTKLGLTNRDGSPLQSSRVQGRKTTRSGSLEAACAFGERDERIRSNNHWSKRERRLEREKEITDNNGTHGPWTRLTRYSSGRANPRTMHSFYLSTFIRS